MASETPLISAEALNRIVAYLLRTEPTTIGSVHVRPDQTVVVLMATGQKYTFTPDQIAVVRAKLDARTKGKTSTRTR